jgi:26S proteasome regulatory subunit N6
VEIRPFFATIPKVRTARIVRTLIDLVRDIPDSLELQAELCRESVAWCVREKRTFLKQRISARLASVLLELKDYKQAIKVISAAVREVKKIDDKQLLVEIHLIESRVHLRLRNVPKSKGALTSARSAANAIYCPPLLQAEIDQQAGVLCAEENDYKTSFSYFYEAFEGYNTLKRPADAVVCLKYMLLAKVMTDAPQDVYSIINGRGSAEYAGRELDAMRAIADAHKARSIHKYRATYEEYKDQLVDDPVVFAHLNRMYEKLLEQNLLRVVEPFSRVQITHVAKLIDLPLADVESKLSQMILDQTLNGILDQGSGDLIVFEDSEQDKTFGAALETIRELNGVVDKLYLKAKGLR